MTQLLPFNLGPEVYALELVDVQEVVEQQTVHPLPGVAATILGAIAVHGRIVPVIDLPQLLGFPDAERAGRMIVLTDEHGPVALTVDRLQRVINLDLAHSTLSQSASEEDCIRGVLDRNGNMISLLDLERLRELLERICNETGG